MSKCVGVSSTDSVVTESGTSSELVVGNDDTRVNNVGVCVLSSGGVVDVLGGGAGTVADSSETPCSTRLGSQSLLLEAVLVDLIDVIPEVGDCVRLNKGDLILSVFFAPTHMTICGP